MELKRDRLLQGGRYRIIESIGRGGFGITYLAEQVMAKRKVCIKEFFPKDYYKRDGDTGALTLSSDGFAESMNKFKAKFIKEAQTIATLNHANIIPIHDVFEENGTAYYVMDYIEGESLSDIVKRGGAMSERDAVAYIKQVASALEHIHEQQIMHLDVKPGNIMVRSKDNRAILIDFGLSKHYDATSGEATSTTPVGVSHGFAPMEQYQDGGVSTFSPETDIYSLGATLYYLVTGNVP
ncbi:MAG: serine/threonine protein kinase, partial [Alistipes sp.]|nr:serine/threonine protein kinase [Alistipes sp.]